MRSFTLSAVLLSVGFLMTTGRSEAGSFYYYVPPPPMVMSHPMPSYSYGYSAPAMYYVPYRSVYVYATYTTPVGATSKSVAPAAYNYGDYFIGATPASYYPRGRYVR